jgi:hypothetical protein
MLILALPKMKFWLHTFAISGHIFCFVLFHSNLIPVWEADIG